ncbi:MAG: ISL3 family transposase [Metallibacterium scheffleri]
MLDLLGLEHIRPVLPEVRDGVLIVKAEVTAPPVQCPQCKAANPYRHDTREQEFADAPIRGQPVRIQFDRQRYRCRQCRKTFFEPLLGFSSKRNMTQRLVHYIARDSLIRTFADVARDVGLDVQTVRGVFLDFSEWLRVNHAIATPRVLGIDEAKRSKLLCSVFTDIERREYFDMIPSRKATPLNDYLSKMPDKDRIEVVAMDLHQGFVNAIGHHLPKAVRVADRYHVARLAQDGFDKAHMEVRKLLPAGERLAMFRKRGLLAERDRRLTVAERDKVAEILSPFPVLKAAHQAKESFLTVYDAPTRKHAEKALSDWLEVLPQELTGYFRALTSAVSNNRDIILNYFEHRYTNAFTEAANGISKMIQRMGRGYGFEVLRVKLLYGKRGQVIDLTNFDANNDMPAGMIGYAGMGATFASTRKKAGSKSGGKRRGPSFARVSWLVDDGYYDFGSQIIANEMEPLITQFAYSA